MPDMTVSVIMATHNRGDIIKKAIDSVLWQTHKDFELIIVMDRCSDDTAKVVYSYDDPRIKVFKGDFDYYTHVRNYGIKQAFGDLIAIRDDDGLWHPEFLEEHVSRHQTEDVALTYSGRWFYKDIDLRTLDIQAVTKLNGYPIGYNLFIGESTNLNGLVDVGDMVWKAGYKFTEEIDKPSYCSDIELIDQIIEGEPDKKIVLIPRRLHYYFMDHGSRANMTREKLEARERGEFMHEEKWDWA